MNNLLLSICIPTYNRAPYLKELLDSIVCQFDDQEIYNQVEIIISDNASEDNTTEMVAEYQKRYRNIKYSRNKENIGGTRNSFVALKISHGEYLWLAGDDDLFINDAVKHVFSAIKNNKEIGTISINYSQYSEKNKKYICESFFNLKSFCIKAIKNDSDLLFNNTQEYFSVFYDIPSFFPAIVMRRDFWLFTNVDIYLDTYYAHYAAALLNIDKAKILAITKPLIRGLIPIVGWHVNGDDLFSAQLGNVKVCYLIFNENHNLFIKNIFQRKKIFYFRHFLRVVVASVNYGYKASIENKKDLKMIYGRWLYIFYFLPILIIVSLFPKFLIRYSYSFKKLLFNK